MKKIVFLQFAILLLFCNCTSNLKEMVMPEATGSPYDVYIVMPKEMQGSALKDTLCNIFEAPMECTPSGDAYFKTYFLAPENFKSSVIRIVGNAVIVDVDPQNASEPHVSIERNTYAQSQVILKLHAQTLTGLAEYLPSLQNAMRSIFVKAEINRKVAMLKAEYDTKSRDRLMEMLGVSILVPKDMNIPGIGKDSTFFWTTNDGSRKRSDIVVYSIPYTDANVFTLEGAVAVRDSVMKANIEGGDAGSYMTTGKRIILPEYKALNVNGKYVGELKGLWRMENGLMGGPFICHIRLDELNKRVIFAEGFCYAPDDPKRNLIRNVEAILYTLQLPSDNMIPNIEITLDPNE